MIFEVVSGQILLSYRLEFYHLHSKVLLPIMKEIGIVPKILLVTEIGRYGRFLDVYEYEDFVDYDRKTSQLLKHPAIEDYYSKVGKCIEGSITVELMSELPYAKEYKYI